MQTEVPIAESFETLAMPLFTSLYNFAHWLTHNREEAEDLVQETYLKALKGFASFQQGTNFRAWMYRILRNTFLTSRSGLREKMTVPLDRRGSRRMLRGRPIRRNQRCLRVRISRCTKCARTFAGAIPRGDPVVRCRGDELPGNSRNHRNPDWYGDVTAVSGEKIDAELLAEKRARSVQMTCDWAPNLDRTSMASFLAAS